MKLRSIETAATAPVALTQSAEEKQPEITSPEQMSFDYDALLRCLIAVSTHHDRAASEDQLTAGLPLRDGQLTPELAVRAAQRAG